MFKAKIRIAFIALLAFYSCDRNGVYEENVDTSNNLWNENSIAKFRVEVSDTILFHNIYLNVRNTTDYSNSNLYLFVTTISPANFAQIDTIECFLADEQGNWLGKGFGYIRDSRVPYKHNIRFPLKGVYQFEIKQAMRTDELKGIASVGIRIDKSNVK